MPVAASLITVNNSIDGWGDGQLISDSGIITDMDGGFDTASVVVLFKGSGSLPAIGGQHPFGDLFLFGVSPELLAGPDGGRCIKATLSYKGVSGRVLAATGDPPTASSTAAKFTYGIRMTERSAAVGEIEGTVDGVDLSTVAVNIMQPQQTVRASWMARARISDSAFNIPNGKAPAQFGPIDENFYSTITNPIFNYPHGWVPIEASSDQAYPGIGIWANSITYVGIPKFSAS